MLDLVTFLTASGLKLKQEQEQMKVHLACWNGSEHPITVYYAGHFQSWQEHQTRRNFGCSQILSLIDLGRDTWLFVGVYEVLDCQPHPLYTGDFLYATRLLPNQEELIARIIVEHKRAGRQSYIWLTPKRTPEITLPIVEIRREKMTIGDFPGYHSALITHAELVVITQQKVASWHGALANIKGVYLITDSSTGKHYVGKASGGAGIWQRWCAYAENGHAGNVKLKELLDANGPGHTAHFQYSILEIADNHASDEDILARESYWMNVLRTREFGLN